VFAVKSFSAKDATKFLGTGNLPCRTTAVTSPASEQGFALSCQAQQARLLFEEMVFAPILKENSSTVILRTKSRIPTLLLAGSGLLTMFTVFKMLDVTE
jgi:hypothetical protein